MGTEDVEKVVPHPARRLADAAIDVDDVGDFLEDDKGDADWQGDRRQGRKTNAKPPGEDQLSIGVGEVGVLEVRQETEIGGHAQADEQPANAGPRRGHHQPNDDKIERGRAHRDQREHWLAPRIEEDACDERDRVDRADGHGEVQRKDNGQKTEQEQW